MSNKICGACGQTIPARAWDTDVRLVLSEVATWITLAHHRDGCQYRYKKPCDCGRDSVLAKLKFPDAPPSERVPEVTEEDVTMLWIDLDKIGDCTRETREQLESRYANILKAVKYCAAQNRRPDD